MRRLFGSRWNPLPQSNRGEEAGRECAELPTPPGSEGYFRIWDKALNFYRDPVNFVEKMQMGFKSPIFGCRFLNQPTVVICSHSLVEQLLEDTNESTMLGYQMFLEHIYGPNILFTNGPKAMRLREALASVFSKEAVRDYRGCVTRVLDSQFERLEEMISSHKKVCLYKFFKATATEICLSIFLGLDFEKSKELAETIVQLTTAHWHGIISVPVNVKVPGIARTTYSKAQEAKRELLEIIRERRKYPQRTWMFCKHMASCCEELNSGTPDHGDAREERRNSMQGDSAFAEGITEKEINSHFLLFTSALVPKALASLLIWTMVELGRNKDWQEQARTSEEFREFVLLEVQRFYPPFFAGRRIVTEDTILHGYRIPAGMHAMYVTYTAHRDPSVYTDPNTFIPQRWKDCSPEMKKLFSFGAGRRCCLGQNLVWTIVKDILKRLFRQYSWQLEQEPGKGTTPKWLPVSRPKASAMFTLKPLPQEDSDVDPDDLEHMVNLSILLSRPPDIPLEQWKCKPQPVEAKPRIPVVPYHLRPEVVSARLTAEEGMLPERTEGAVSASALSKYAVRSDSTQKVHSTEQRVAEAARPRSPGSCPNSPFVEAAHTRLHPTRVHPTSPLGAHRKLVLPGGHFVSDHSSVAGYRPPCLPSSDQHLLRDTFPRSEGLSRPSSLHWVVQHPAPGADNQLSLKPSKKDEEPKPKS